jgi:integrative and conjugative element protein (TIGR02256 family)
MEFSRVIVSRKSLSVIRAEAIKARKVETGGVLVGYVDKRNGVLVVTDASGPGSKAILEPFSVVIDGEHAQEFCDRCLRESGDRIDYVGDWHKHPGFCLQPSSADSLAIKAMAEFQHSPTKHPISLIYRRWPSSFKAYIWDGSGSLKILPSAVESGTLLQ